MSGSPTLGSPTKQKKTLDSEVSTEEAEALLTFVQTISSSFRGFLADEVTVLSENLSVMRFDEEQVVMQKGESGSWFGVLLSGTLTVKITDTILIPIPAGAIIGEMAMWHRGAERSATIVGGQPGLIATMLVDEIGSLMVAYPAVGAKLMRMLGRTAISKTLENKQRERTAKLKPTIQWGKVREAVQSAASLDMAGVAHRAQLMEKLKARGFEEDECAQLISLAKFDKFKQGQVLVEQGQLWDIVMVIIQGSVLIERENIEVADGGFIGALEFFGESHFTQTSAVNGATDGMLAGWTIKQLNDLVRGRRRAHLHLHLHLRHHHHP